MAEIDPRIVRLGIEVNGVLKFYEGLAIKAVGMKFANANQNECEVEIANLDKTTRDFILTETSPFNQNRTPKRFVLDVGRVGTGTTRIFTGDITSVIVSQPPDITLTLKSLTKDHSKGDIVNRTHPARTPLSRISKQVAQDLNLNLNFQAPDKYINNYSFCGGKLKQVNKLGEAGEVNCYVDDDSLVVKAANAPLVGQVRKLNLDTGMIGIPEITEHGVKVTFLIDSQTRLGAGLEITSVINPTLNGTYIIYKLGFNVASRDTPFYYIAWCKRRV